MQINLPLRNREESWSKVRAQLGSRQTEVIGCLESRWASGLSAWEISEITGRLVHAVRPRLTELRKKGMIEAVGKRFCEKTDRNETVWRII